MKKSILFLFASLILIYSASAQAPCVGSQSITATPLPGPNGIYIVGTTVTFCYTVSNYSQSGADWIAGVVPTFGPGWDLSTLTPTTIPPSCDGQGAWGWYLSCTGTASGQTFGPGFYYDSPAGSPNFTLDGIPGNNYGDNCQNNTWVFCFSITVGPCGPPGTENLDVNVTALSDYTAGSWGTDACVDPPATFPATAQCNCSLIVASISVTDASCGNANDGSITVFPQGVAPYSYQWSNGATTQTISNIPPGIYTCTVTDSVFCDKTVTIPVGGPAPIILNETIVDNTCDTSSASITLAPTGGTGSGYTYLWNTGATGSSLSNLTGGSYIVSVTDTNGCVATDTFAIASVIPLDLTTSSTLATCNGSDGTATATLTGGTQPYTYDWQPIGGNAATATNLPSGTYTVNITDANGCTVSGQVTVQAIGSFTLTSSFVPLACDPLGTTSATVNVNGGTPPYSYQWTPSGGTQATATGLTSGTYVVYVTDSNNCIDSSTVVIPPVIPLVLNVSSTPVQCNQPNSGTASVTVTGGVAPYTYLWSDGSTASSAGNLSGGTYTVTITDANGCTSSNTITVTVIPDVFVTAGNDQTVCSGDAASLSGSATGGTSPFNYSWNNGINAPDQTVNPGATTTYVLIVTDANGCTANDSVTVNVIDYPVITVSLDDSICFGSSTSLIASGGSTYSWSPASGLDNPNISNPVASPAGTTTYTVTVSNAQCASTASVTVNVAPEILASFNPDSVQGQAPLTVNFSNTSTGGDSLLWNFGDGSSSTEQNPTHVYTELGSYTVELIAYNSSFGCSDTIRFSYILVETTSSLVVPNIFTPNGDLYNDVFEFQEIGISQISVNILNRWGKEVFSWSKINGFWDGKSDGGDELPEGVYVYLIKAKGIDGKSYNLSGTVQLIRNKK